MLVVSQACHLQCLTLPSRTPSSKLCNQSPSVSCLMLLDNATKAWLHVILPEVAGLHKVTCKTGFCERPGVHGLQATLTSRAAQVGIFAPERGDYSLPLASQQSHQGITLGNGNAKVEFADASLKWRLRQFPSCWVLSWVAAVAS